MKLRLPQIILFILACQLVVILVLIVQRSFTEARYIPSTAMQPTLEVGDRLFLEKVSKWKSRVIERGAIICFYAPKAYLPGRQELSNDLPHILGRLTGLPLFPNDTAFIKRIIGLPGDSIQIKAGRGVYVNGKLLNEPYTAEAASYNLEKMSDIRGRTTGSKIEIPYEGNENKIVVPKGMLFVLGDNRNKSQDSHVWGFLSEERIIGRLWLLLWPCWQYAHEPNWVRK